MGLCGATVRHWLKRFNARGLQGLEEDARIGRPPTYSAAQRSAVIDTALTRPADLGLPFASWTLDRLVAHLAGQGIAMRRSRISEIFLREGLRWRREAGSQRDLNNPLLAPHRAADRKVLAEPTWAMARIRTKSSHIGLGLRTGTRR